jgi:transposase-like protein
MQSALNAPHLCNEKTAIAYVESRLWPDGAVCPHCGTIGEATKLKGKSTRPGLWKCRACRKPFTVRMRTVFESSHIPLHIWLQAIYLVCSSKKGISTRQLQRTFGGSLKTAWFLGHRIREAMTDLGISDDGGPLGGEGKFVEADETFVGGKDPQPRLQGTSPKASGCRFGRAQRARPLSSGPGSGLPRT